jgi:hypothetical protein
MSYRIRQLLGDGAGFECHVTANCRTIVVGRYPTEDEATKAAEAYIDDLER